MAIANDKSKEEEEEDHDDDPNVAAVMPPDGGFGWVIVVVGFMGGVVVDGIIFSFGIVFSEILLAFGSGKSETAWVGSVMAGMYLTVGPIVSALANRYGCRLVCIIGAVIGAIGLFLSAFAQSVEFLIFSYGILGGIGFGFIYLPCIVMVQFYFDKRRAFATGISVCGSGMGAFVFAPLSTFVINHYGWRGNMLIQAAIVTNMIALGGLLRPPQNPRKIRQPNKPLLQRIKEARDAAFHKSSSSHSINNGDMADFINEKEHLKIANPIDPLKKPFGWNAIGNEMSLDTDRTRRYTWSSVGMPTSLTIEEAVEEDEEENNSGRTDSASSSTPLTTHQESLQVNDSLAKSRPVSLIVTKPSPRSTPSSSRRKSLPLEVPEEMMRPFYRQDIFFSGSLLRIPQFSSQPSLQQYHSSVMSLPKYSLEGDDENSGSCFKSILCPKTMRHTIGTMLDFSLLRSVTFLVLCAASFITMMGFFVPFVYLAEYSRSIGISKEDSGLLFSAIGITNTLGRVFSGWVSDRPQVNALLITNVALTTGGLATALVPFLTRYDFLVAYCSTFGLAIACFASLRSIILVELLGLEKLTNAFGLLLLFQGVASIIGSPMAGFFFDITKSYDTSFIIAGSLITLSGLLGFPLPYIAKWETRRRRNKQMESDTKQNGDVTCNDSRDSVDANENDSKVVA